MTQPPPDPPSAPPPGSAAASPLRDLVDATGRELARAAEKLEQLYRNSFVDTADGSTGDTLPGLRRGVVVDTLDPLQRHRVQVRIPSLSDLTPWAERVATPGAPAPDDLAVGAEVWLAFEDGEAIRPVVIGQVVG